MQSCTGLFVLPAPGLGVSYGPPQAGNDFLNIGPGNDALYVGTGDDVLVGGGGSSVIIAGDGVSGLRRWGTTCGRTCISNWVRSCRAPQRECREGMKEGPASPMRHIT